MPKATEMQKHGAQSEAFQRSTSPMGFLSKSAPTIFQNEERFAAAHSSRPAGAKIPKQFGKGG